MLVFTSAIACVSEAADRSRRLTNLKSYRNKYGILSIATANMGVSNSESKAVQHCSRPIPLLTSNSSLSTRSATIHLQNNK